MNPWELNYGTPQVGAESVNPWEMNYGEQKEKPSTLENIGEVAKYAVNPTAYIFNNPEIGRTIFDQGMQGATLGFADEIQDRIGAGIASLATGEDYGNILDQGRLDTEARLQQQRAERPALSTAANISGAILTPGASLVSNSIRGGGLGARIAKGATVGATAGGAYGAGSATEGSRLEGAKEGALLGGVTGAAVPAIGAMANSGLKRLAKPGTIQATADDIRGLASEQYKLAAEKGGVLKSNIIDKFADEVQAMTPQTAQGKILSGDSNFTKLAEKIQQLKGQNASLDAAQEIDELLSEQIDNFVDRTTGKITKEGQKVLQVQNRFRNAIENATEADIIGGKEGFEALKEGRKLWSKSARLRDIERIITRAEMTDNPKTALKTGFRNLAMNAKRIRGYSPEEVKLIQKAADSGAVGDLLGILGSRLNSIIAGSTGGLGAGAAASALGMASRGANTKLQLSRANKVASKIAGDISVAKEPTIVNRIAQRLLQGSKPTVSEINKMTPKDAKATLNLLKQTEGMDEATLRAFIEQNTK